MIFTAINPATGAVIRRYPGLSAEAAGEAVDRVARAFQRWRGTGLERRSELLLQLARLLRKECHRQADLITEEMGKPVVQARAEVEKCARVCEYYAEHGPAFLQDEVLQTDARRSFVTYQPLGVILAIMPWNFPFWQVFRFAAPALLAGNGAVLKHASNVPGCALALEGLFRKAGFPEDLFRTLLIGSRQVEAIIAHPSVRAVTLTGSGPAGCAVAAQAGRLLKKTVMELGGSDPYVVLDDADLEIAATACVTGRLLNSGQSCIAAKRFVVVESVQASFTELVRQKLETQKVGDPREESTDIGPLAREDLRLELHGQVDESIRRGAICLLGGKLPSGPGWFYPATLLAGVTDGMPAYDQELFGPVATIIAVKDEPEALRVANDTSFGLGAAVFTQDTNRGERIAREAIEAGSCFVNAFVRSDPRLPFGGVKESGYGRELCHHGLREFTNAKTVWIR